MYTLRAFFSKIFWKKQKKITLRGILPHKDWTGPICIFSISMLKGFRVWDNGLNALYY